MARNSSFIISPIEMGKNLFFVFLVFVFLIPGQWIDAKSFQEGDWFLETQIGAFYHLPVEFYQDQSKKSQLENLSFTDSKLGLGYYFQDGWGSYFYLSFTSFRNGESDQIKAGSFSYRLRGHLYQNGDFGFFVEAGAAIAYSEEPIPNESGNWNFILSLGSGVSLQLRNHIFFLLGIRFHHLTNAGILCHSGQKTIGFDSLGGFLGMSFKF